MINIIRVGQVDYMWILLVSKAKTSFGLSEPTYESVSEFNWAEAIDTTVSRDKYRLSLQKEGKPTQDFSFTGIQYRRRQ